MTRESRSILLCIPPSINVAHIALSDLLEKYGKTTGYAGEVTVEVHLVMRERPIAERLAMLTQAVRERCDLVIWSACCAEVGRACKAHLEKLRGMEPDTLHHAVITRVPAPPGTGFPLYRSDMFFYGPASEPVS